ncbi:Alpha-amylase 3, chloroplastic [Glycine soja]|uniref:Alpha-amylase 3, chloroplastic n=1 Tax=Glycine soja TaxID=3848 RepID=A0A445FSC3_GLYSO|nr:Alpha-amylase 3, chloroplastic [Glycine soja]
MSISTTTTPLFSFNHYFTREREPSIHRSKPKPFSLTSSSTLTLFNSNNSCNYSFASCKLHKFHTPKFEAFAANTDTLESLQSSDVLFDQIFPINQTELTEWKYCGGKDLCKIGSGEGFGKLEAYKGCNLSGKWILHWGVSRVDDVGSEWDQPPLDMIAPIPPGSIPIKDYAIETPMKKSLSSTEGDILHEVKIDLKPNNDISAINFVLKDEETGAWYQHKGRDFKGPWGQISNILLKSEATHDKVQDDNSGSRNTKVENSQLEETDIPGDILLHWGVCRDNLKWWEIPPAPHPPETLAFKDRALRTKLQNGIWNIFGGRANWDDRAIVADDPYFQGRGNKSSGDNFHAAPNIDHS